MTTPMKVGLAFVLVAIITMVAAVTKDILFPYDPISHPEVDYVINPARGSYESRIDGANLYWEVTILNRDYKAFHDSLGIDHVYDRDWVETANAMGLPVDCLTIDMYLDFMKNGLPK